ncbi:type II toxin-antitoxin system ParD family antitoxin [uncultured Tateyamaria sp.]|uniref:type II toxin-antitoxin system ParD family antitoxin n=1 Tax=uncultured Tateyamaria sp. TaxID=455651 RepID=UPI002624755B|nr:type II toxin-antitoxin system ParD family antitoxin [uncultured Tateyamaria sp.]
MTRTTSVALGDHFAQFITEQVAAGRYASASDVVRSGLRLLEEREAQMTALRAALEAGEASGPAAPFDVDAYVADRRGAG